MTSPASISAPDHSESKPTHQHMAVWALVGVVFLVVACAVLVMDASITPEQRFTVFLQSGMFP